ncbi:MAG TPA: glycosyltransferase family 4 protein [Rhodocyclaceae bacterium]
MLSTVPSSRRHTEGLRHPQARHAAKPSTDPQKLPGATRLPHVCFVAPETWPVLSGDERTEVVGGAELQQSLIARMLVRAGYRVSMICLDYGQPARVNIDGIDVIRAHRPDAGIPVLRFVHPRITAMWRAMRAVDADIYYQRSPAALTAVVAAFCRRHGRQSIYAGASDTDFLPGQQTLRFRRDRWLFERALATVDAIVVQNETQQRDCREHYQRRSTVIPSCYELPADARPGAGDRVLWVGTMRPDKRPDILLELARRLPHRRFAMIGGAARGDAGGEAYYKAIAAAAAHLPNVEMLGFLPLSRTEPWFDRARMLVSTSSVEGMPNVFLQAWARGVPTVAFIDVGARLDGAPVYPVAKDAAEAAAQIERLFEDDIERAHAGARCRDYFAARHSSHETLACYRRVLDELVDRRARAARR